MTILSWDKHAGGACPRALLYTGSLNQWVPTSVEFLYSVIFILLQLPPLDALVVDGSVFLLLAPNDCLVRQALDYVARGLLGRLHFDCGLLVRLAEVLRKIDFFASYDCLIAAWEKFEKGQCASLGIWNAISNEIGAVEVELLAESRLLDITLLHAALDLDLFGLFWRLTAALDLKLQVEGLVGEDVDTDWLNLNVEYGLVFTDSAEGSEHFGHLVMLV